jgi:cysteine synthase A
VKHFSILETIGATPTVRISDLFPEAIKKNIKIWIKLERANPGGSIKDRMALAMIEDGIRSGVISGKTTIIEASSGNTGIGLAMVAAVKKLNIIVVMPESVSIERRKIIEAYGGQVELTPAALGMKGAIDHAGQLRKKMKNSWISSQFTNIANREIHERTTSKEIISDFPLGLDYLFAGIGTGGHISGCANSLKGKYPNIIINGVEPDASAVLSGEKPAPHKIQGIGAGFVPQILLRDHISNIVRVTDEEADRFRTLLPKETGIFAGISTGANLAAIDKSIKNINSGSTVLTFCNDTGERYLA